MKIKNKQEKLEYLHNLAKETDIHTLLAEILPSLGFHDVYITHERGNAPENGKDVICSLLDTLEDKKDWYAFVVKKGKVSGTSSEICTINSQIKDCFKYEYKSLNVRSERVRINKVKVVTNERFSTGAKDKILQDPDIDKANVDFWDDEKLIKLIDAKCPKFWQQGSPTYKKYVDALISTIDQDDFSKRLGLSEAKIKKLVNLFIEPTLLEKEILLSGDVVYKKRKVKSVLQSTDNVFIVGDSGTGKSTLFKQLAKEIVEDNALRDNYELYPIMLTFNKLRSNNYSLLDAIRNNFQEERYATLNIDVDEILHDRKCVIFIDALDEIASNSEKEKAFTCINDFSVEYPDIRLVCTSRPSDFLSETCAANNFKTYEIDRIDRRQMTQFIQSYFGDNLSLSKRLIKSLRDTGLLNKLPQTPMTLALITIIFDEKQIEIPSTITDLYSIFVDLLLKKFEFRSTHDIIETDIKYRVLSHLAKHMHANRLTSIASSEAEGKVACYLSARGMKGITSEDLLNEIISNNGLLIFNDRGDIEFKHLSFQEYFTAYEYYNHLPGEKDIFIQNFKDIWWQNVAIFYAGFSKDAPLLLKDIIENGKQVEGIISRYNVMMGIGRLMQSLYSTPVNDRVSGIELTAGHASKIVQDLITTSDPKFAFFKKFSKYNIYMMIQQAFEQNHHSITLQQPLQDAFDKMYESFSQDEEKSFQDTYSLFLMATSMGNSSFLNFSPYKRLLEEESFADLSLFASEEMCFRMSYKELTEEQRNEEDVMWIRRKIRKRMSALGDITSIVNKPISEAELPPLNNIVEADE